MVLWLEGLDFIFKVTGRRIYPQKAPVEFTGADMLIAAKLNKLYNRQSLVLL